MRLGVNPKDAYAWIRTRMGDWRVAQSPILKTTITLARLKKRGYIATLELYHQTGPSNQPAYTKLPKHPEGGRGGPLIIGGAGYSNIPNLSNCLQFATVMFHLTLYSLYLI